VISRDADGYGPAMSTSNPGTSHITDPFISSHPAVLVHEIDPHQFEALWRRKGDDAAEMVCPLCARGTAVEQGTSRSKNREWIAFSCGDVVTAEMTAG
jgi:hypothetical protein